MPKVDSTRAKIRVYGVAKNGEYETITGYPVTDDDTPENEKFYKASPGGLITLTVSNPNVHGFFEVNKTYYVDFTPCNE